MKKLLATSLLFFPLFLAAQDKSVKALQAESGKTISKDPADTSKKNGRTVGFIVLIFHRDR